MPVFLSRFIGAREVAPEDGLVAGVEEQRNTRDQENRGTRVPPDYICQSRHSDELASDGLGKGITPFAKRVHRIELGC